MNKKIKKYIDGSIIITLLLTFMSLQTVIGANFDNSDNIVDVEREVSSNDNGNVENILDGVDGEVITDNMSEDNAAVKEDTLQDVVSNNQKETFIISKSENLIEYNRVDENSDSEDVTDDFKDPFFQAAVREELGLSDSEPITKARCGDRSYLYLNSSYNSKKIKSLEGIENFTGLSVLHCESNQLISLDLSWCTNLSELYCGSNQLINLNVSGCKKLSKLKCGYNKLTNLDISSCPNLLELDCGSNELTSLDVSGCIKLLKLYCGNNELTSLDVSSCTNLSELSCVDELTNLNISGCVNLLKLYCSGKLTNLDVSACANLLELYCRDSELRSLDVSGCADLLKLDCGNNELTDLDVSRCVSLSELSCGNNQLIELDVHENTNLKSLNVAGCHKLTKLRIDGSDNLESLDIKECSKITELNLGGYTKLRYLKVEGCSRIKSINLKDCSNLTSIQLFWSRDFPELSNINMENCFNINDVKLSYCYSLVKANLSGCSKLKKLSVRNCSELKELNLGGCKNLEELNAEGCDVLPDLDVRECNKLRILEFGTYGCSIPSVQLNIDGCINLENLSCYGHPLKKLDLSNCPNLTDLSCWSDELEELDVTNCVKLEHLYCEANKLKELDLSKCIKLKKLWCYKNQLTSLDVSNCSELIGLDCSYNNMKSPDDVKGRIREFDGESFVFYPQNKNTNKPITPTSRPTAKPTLTPVAPTKIKKPQKTTVTPKSFTLHVDGKSKTLKVSNAKGKVTYKSSKPKVAKVDSKGKVTPKSSGKTTITIKIAGNSSYKAATIKVKVKVVGLNVTNKYKVKTQKILCNFDQYFGYCCGKGAIFKYDVYARTNMLSIPNLHKILGKSTKYAKDELSDEMKLFFGTASVKYKKFSSRYKWSKDPTYIVVSKNGKVEYTSGNWGWGVPRGKVTKIIKTSGKKYVVTYSVYRYNWYEKKVMHDMGEYKITMKKSSNKNGFIITNIERTQTNNIPL